MSEAPKTLWMNFDPNHPGQIQGIFGVQNFDDDVLYIRADLVKKVISIYDETSPWEDADLGDPQIKEMLELIGFYDKPQTTP